MTTMIANSFRSTNERFACDPSWHSNCLVCPLAPDWFVYCIRRHRLVHSSQPMWLSTMTLLHLRKVVREQFDRMIPFDLHSCSIPLRFWHSPLSKVFAMALDCSVVALMFDRFVAVDLVRLHPSAMSNLGYSRALHCHVWQRPPLLTLPFRWNWTYCRLWIVVNCDRMGSAKGRMKRCQQSNSKVSTRKGKVWFLYRVWRRHQSITQIIKLNITFQILLVSGDWWIWAGLNQLR